jgi:hypothetical protein
MKINMPETGPEPFDQTFKVGNVYRAKGGKKTQFFILVGFDESQAFFLGINREGKLTSATNYGRQCFEGNAHWLCREVVGFCSELADMELNIEWSCP